MGDGGADGSLSSSSAIRINGVTNRFAVNQSDTVTQGTDFGAAAISGNGGFTQAGSGTTILNAVNTYTGGTEVDAGTLEIAGTGQLESGAYGGNISIASGATFKYNSSAAQTLSGRIDGAGDFVKDSSSVLTLSGQIKNHTGSTTINAGTIIAGATDQYGTTSKYFINSGALLQMNGFSNVERDIGGLNDGVSGGGTVENGAATDVTLTLDSTGDHSFSGVIQDGSGGGALSLALKVADTQTLTGNNTFTGDISGGNQAELMIDGAGTLGWNGSVGDYAGNITMNQRHGLHLRQLRRPDLERHHQRRRNRHGSNDVNVSGSGTLTLTGTNTYTGRTNISTTLEIQNSEALGTGLVVLTGGGELQFGADALDLSETVLVQNSGDNRTIRLDLAGTNTGTLSGQLDIRSNGAQLFDIDVGADDTLSVTSVIIGAGSAGLTKEGDGTLIIEANSTYTGATTVNGGTLEISATAGTNVPGSASYQINNGSTLFLNETTASNLILGVGVGDITFGSSDPGGTLQLNGNTIFRNQTITTTGGAKNFITGVRFNMQNSRSIIFDTAVGTDVDGIDLEVSATISGGDIIKDGAGTVSLTNSANNLGTQGGGTGRSQHGHHQRRHA